MAFYFGPAGWSYDDWNGVVYPRPRPRGFHPLPYLAQCVNCVEVNGTFYAPLAASTSTDWVRRLDDFPDFRFVVKVWRRFTHERALPTSHEIATWCEVLRPLVEAGRLLGSLVQFPFSVREGEWVRDRLLRIRSFLPRGVPVATEFRHRSFISDTSLSWLENQGFSFVNIDQPTSRESIPPTNHVTSPLAYARLHGRNTTAWFDRDAGRDARYDWRYSKDEVREWAGRLATIRARGETTVLVGNNHFQGNAMAVVLELAHELTGTKRAIPEPILMSFPELEGKSRPAPGHLF
ncbi:MAG: hypothetical protein CMJ83_19770 [Planctomycetes bacterium]|nr:hypothetical protein [Planctomycetota bacterium]